MKNILLIMPYGGVGGMERLAIYLHNHYKNQGYNVKVLKIIKLKTDIVNFGGDEYFLSDIDFTSMSFLSRLFFYLKAPLSIRRLINNNNVNFSIAFGDMANVFSSLSFTGEFKIASIHALKSVEFTSKNFLNIIFKLAFKSSYYFLDKVVCISEAIKKDLITNCDFSFPEKLKVIYNPHDINQMLSMSLEPIELNDELRLFEQDVILFLGRLSIQKSPWHLVKAFSQVVKNNNNLNLIFIGDGDDNVLKYLKILIEELNIKDKVFFLGRKSNPYQYLKKANVLALSSYYEGTPNVIVEAIANEVPIVTSNCTDGIIELMSNSQLDQIGQLLETESGIITPNFFKGSLSIPKNNELIEEEILFAKALDLVLSNKKYKEKLIENKEKLLKKFNIENIAEQYLKK
jgi:glycosyltransferase involved in cell wall biosynthesis